MWRKLILVCAAACLAGSLAGAERGAVRALAEGSILVPEKPADGAPLLVIVEGGQRGRQVLEMLKPALLEKGIVAVAPTLPQRDPEAGKKALEPAEALVKAVESEYGLKTGKRYALSFSASGPLGYQAAFSNPGKFAGLLVIASMPPGPPSVGAELLAGGKALPVLLAHGTNDPMFGVERGRQAEKILKEAGYRVTFRVVEGADHMGMVNAHAGKYLDWVVSGPK
ncbi:MAG: hypothetical protein M5U26_08020 [Planctomycetota bacterium]|nr:hypothetical protein [Planctomycetota bacterium]